MSPDKERERMADMLFNSLGTFGPGGPSEMTGISQPQVGEAGASMWSAKITEKDAAILDLLKANDRIGSWLSAALEDPMACAEFKADIEAWMDEDQTLRRVMGV